MSVSSIYAKAFYDYVKTSGSKGVEVEQKELQELAVLLQESKELKLALFGPMISSKEKIAIIEQVTEALKISKLTKFFLIFLVNKRRFNIVENIIEDLDQVRLESEGGLLGELTTADPIEDSQVQELAKAFSDKLKRTVKFKVKTNEQLLAGVKIIVNGVSYDGSLKAQLDGLKESFIRQSNQIH